jgi:exopolysaccharide biosynthesis polyprenyl glycosylphosphotransferase
MRSPSVAKLPPVMRRVGLGRPTPVWIGRFIVAVFVTDLASGAVGAFVAGAVARSRSVDISRTMLAEAALLPIAFVAMTASERVYEPRFIGSGTKEFKRVSEAAVRFGVLVAVVSLLLNPDAVQEFVFVAFPLTTLVALMLRVGVRRLVAAMRESGRCMHRVVVLGDAPSAARMVAITEANRAAGHRVVALCGDDYRADFSGGIPIFRGPEAAISAVGTTGADIVAVTASAALSQDDLRRLSWALEGSGVAFVLEPSVTDVVGPRISVRPLAGLPLLHVSEPEFGGIRRLAKAAFDRTTALIVGVALLPVLLAVAIVVALDSPGPVIFRQRRVGLDGSTFVLWKFRSMRVDAEARRGDVLANSDHADGVLFKMRTDPRVTRSGRWLRRLSLDELPQLVNVLRGEMSLVGPRPPLREEVERYGSSVRRRLLVKPGITGLWQVSGRSDLAWDESVRLDLFYVENWSLALDLSILFRTFRAVVRREGAY